MSDNLVESLKQIDSRFDEENRVRPLFFENDGIDINKGASLYKDLKFIIVWDCSIKNMNQIPAIVIVINFTKDEYCIIDFLNKDNHKGYIFITGTEYENYRYGGSIGKPIELSFSKIDQSTNDVIYSIIASNPKIIAGHTQWYIRNKLKNFLPKVLIEDVMEYF